MRAFASTLAAWARGFTAYSVIGLAVYCVVSGWLLCGSPNRGRLLVRPGLPSGAVLPLLVLAAPVVVAVLAS